MSNHPPKAAEMPGPLVIDGCTIAMAFESLIDGRRLIRMGEDWDCDSAPMDDRASAALLEWLPRALAWQRHASAEPVAPIARPEALGLGSGVWLCCITYAGDRFVSTEGLDRDLINAEDIAKVAEWMPKALAWVREGR